MKNLVKLISPAKVNLVLAVGAKRADGFHRVDTVMHSLALHDTLEMRRLEEDEGGLAISLTCEYLGGIAPLDVPAEENIVYRAVSALACALGRDEDETIQIRLSKVIPAQAGLGGGSSNAAAALLGAAALWDVAPDDARLRTVAASLGADVPFFLAGGCARLSGRGDVLEAKLAPRKDFVLLARPDTGVSTAAAYAAFDADPHFPDQERLAALAAFASACDIDPLNNLEAATCQVAPQVADVLAWARGVEGAKTVLCGSGSAVCLIMPSYEAAYEASIAARARRWWVRVTSFSSLGAAVLHAY